MSRRAVGAIVSIVIIAGCLAGAGFWVGARIYASRGQGALSRAEKAYSEGLWLDAKTNYSWYLARHPGDPMVLPRYIESCLKLVNNRYANLQDAGRAYLQLAMAKPSDLDLARQTLDFCRKHGLWRELDYSASVFLRDNPDDTEVNFAKALAMDRLGRSVQATDVYQRLVDSGKAPAEAYGNLALLLQQQGLQEQGWQVLEKALTEHPDDPLVHVERVRFLLAVNDFGGALRETDAVIATGTEMGEIWLVAAKAYMANKDWKNAQAFAEKALSKLPESAECLFIISNAHLANREPDKAVAFLSGIDPVVMADNPQLYLFLIELQIDAGLSDEVDRSIEAYRTAYPGNRSVFDYLSARRLLRKGLASESAAKLETVVEQAPEIRAARFYLALAYLETGQRDRAKNALEMYMKSNPGDERARVIWDTTFVEVSAQNAEAAAEELLKTEDPPSGSLELTARVLAQPGGSGDQSAKRQELAIRLLERSIERSPNVPQGYKNLAFVYLDQSKLDEARRVLAQAQSAGIEPKALNLVRAALALADNNADQAKTLFSEERGLGPMSPQTAREWAELFAQRGNLDAGLEVLESVRTSETVAENVQKLDLAGVDISMRCGNVEKARSLIGDLAAKYPESSAVTSRLNDSRMIIAKALLAPGDRQDKAAAERILSEVESSEPERVDAKVLRTRLLLEKDPPDLDGADAMCAAARKTGPTDPEILLLSSEIASRKGLFASALDYATQAQAASPNQASTLMVLARAHMQTEQFADAILPLEKARTLEPANPVIPELLARAYAGVQRFSDAEALVRQLEEANGGQQALALRAWILVARKDWAGAEQLLRKLHDVSPDDLWTIHCLARSLAGQGQYDQGETFLNECTSRNGQSPELWVELGNFYLTQSDEASLSKASLAFTQALVLRAEYLPAMLGVFDVQMRMGNLGGALGLCDRFLEKNPDDPDMLERKASLLARLPGRQKDSLATIQRAIELEQRPEFFFLRGCLHLDLGSFAEAVEDFKRMELARGISTAALDTLMAEAFLGLNNVELATSYYGSAKEKAAKGEQVDPERMKRVANLIAEAGKK